MSHPYIRISLISDGKTLLKTNGSGKTNEVMSEIYGIKVAKDLVHIQGDTSDYHLEGFVAKPEHSRSNKHYISIFINGRYIKNFVLNKAIIEGYHTLLTIGRYPICYLNIEMDPILVDVNVHPTKLEVRLSKEEQLYQLIVEKIRYAFKDRILIPQNDLDRTPKKNKVLNQFEQQKLDFERRQQNSNQDKTNSHYYGMSESKLQNPNLEKNDLDNNELINESTENFVHNNKRSDDKDYFQIQKEILNDLDNGDASLLNDESTNDSEEVVTEQSNNDEASSKTYQTLYSKQDNNDIKGKVSNTPSRRVPYMEVVGQVHGTYIIAQNENGMFMIDQRCRTRTYQI